jgi:hypothetical protein
MKAVKKSVRVWLCPYEWAVFSPGAAGNPLIPQEILRKTAKYSEFWRT